MPSVLGAFVNTRPANVAGRDTIGPSIAARSPQTMKHSCARPSVVAGRSWLPLVNDACAGRVLSGEAANEIRDALGEELAETGVEGNPAAINERGRRLDDLIDAVGRAST